MRQRLRMWLRRSVAEREIETEFEFHLERETEKNVGEGMAPREAARAARLSFGGEDRYREKVRDVWSGALFSGLGQDVRIGLRRLARRPGFTAVALLTLGLGIGANTVVFSLVEGVLLEPLPYPDADRLVMIWHEAADLTQDTWLSAREVLEYRRATESFEHLAAYTDFDAGLTEGEPERVRAGAVTANAFAALGVEAVLGRTFTAAEDVPGRDDVVVLAHGLWQRRFGGADNVVGRTIAVNGRARTVVGVMPRGFRLPLDYREEQSTELWVPAAIDPSDALPWGSREYFIFGRLADAVDLDRANADIERALDLWVEQGHIDRSDGDWARDAVPFRQLLFGGVRPALLVLFGAVGFVLLIACVNVAHLLLARGDAERVRIATQAALGASRFRLVRQHLVEVGLLAVSGAAVGLFLAYGGLRAALTLAPVNVIRVRGASIDPEALGFAVLVSLATMILAGLAPALRLSAAGGTATLARSRGGTPPARRALRRGLVVAEVALSLVLVVGAALMARSLAGLRAVDLGFDPGDVLTLRIDLPSADYEGADRRIGFYRELLDRVERLPRVGSAGATRLLPLTGRIGEWSITLDDPAGEAVVSADWQIVTPGYFEAMDAELARGRSIGTGDHESAPLVAVVNRTMADRYWPGRDAIGQRFHLGTADQPWIEVVGVVRDIRHNGVVEDSRAEMYIPHAHWPRATGSDVTARGMTLVVRATDGDALALAPAVREQVRAIDASLPVAEVRRLDDVVDEALAEPRFTATLLGAFALLALGLAAVGLYGVISFMAARRTREIGLRVALGARRGDVLRLVLGEGVVLTASGILLGVLGALGLTRLLAGMLYGVSATDPVTFMTVAALLGAVAFAASYLPARRAARTDPMRVLRVE
ncbi:MAG: ADOP family duplicated permease [Gemmatimonadota bacterium]